jgi:Na+/H+ antiporter NhaB
MHGAVGTALGGVSTTVGEPQNLLIASAADWTFVEFFIKMLPISFPVFIAGLLTCYLIENQAPLTTLVPQIPKEEMAMRVILPLLVLVAKARQ